MIKRMRFMTVFLAAAVAVSMFAACGDGIEKKSTIVDTVETTPDNVETDEGIKQIVLSSDTASLDGQSVEEFDYTWHCDPGVSHDEVDNAPAEYYTGAKPETDAAVYIDHELFYFPQLPAEGFSLVNYDGEKEWAYHYTDGEHDEYIFATLPNPGNQLPTQMMHSEEEAAQNKVLHITKAGTYVLAGQWRGQIWVDLGERDETFADENAKVTLILNGAQIDCSVAPGVVFYSAYECDNAWEDQETWSQEVDTQNAGANVIIAEDSENTVTGTNVFRMLQTKYKDENADDEIKVQKRLRKTDAAFYSYVTMNIMGEEEESGMLTINSGFEGLDSELHLSILGGNIVINSQDDGINVNEDHVSVARFLGGSVLINPAQGAEGDGIDSNGYIVVNGGNIAVNGVVAPDSALDSEDGIYYYSGTITLDGQEQQYQSGDVFRETGRMEQPGQQPDGMGQPPEFGQRPDDMGEPPIMSEPGNFDIQEFKQQVAALEEDATFADVLALLGMGNPMQGQQPPQKP